MHWLYMHWLSMCWFGVGRFGLIYALGSSRRRCRASQHRRWSLEQLTDARCKSFQAVLDVAPRTASRGRCPRLACTTPARRLSTGRGDDLGRASLGVGNDRVATPSGRVNHLLPFLLGFAASLADLVLDGLQVGFDGSRPSHDAMLLLLGSLATPFELSSPGIGLGDHLIGLSAGGIENLLGLLLGLLAHLPNLVLNGVNVRFERRYTSEESLFLLLDGVPTLIGFGSPGLGIAHDPVCATPGGLDELALFAFSLKSRLLNLVVDGFEIGLDGRDAFEERLFLFLGRASALVKRPKQLRATPFEVDHHGASLADRAGRYVAEVSLYARPQSIQTGRPLSRAERGRAVLLVGAVRPGVRHRIVHGSLLRTARLVVCQVWDNFGLPVRSHATKYPSHFPDSGTADTTYDGGLSC